MKLIHHLEIICFTTEARLPNFLSLNIPRILPDEHVQH